MPQTQARREIPPGRSAHWPRYAVPGERHQLRKRMTSVQEQAQTGSFPSVPVLFASALRGYGLTRHAAGIPAGQDRQFPHDLMDVARLQNEFYRARPEQINFENVHSPG